MAISVVLLLGLSALALRLQPPFHAMGSSWRGAAPVLDMWVWGWKGVKLCVQDLMFLSRGDRDLRFPYQTHPRSQASPRGEGKDSALLSSRDGYVLESTE